MVAESSQQQSQCGVVECEDLNLSSWLLYLEGWRRESLLHLRTHFVIRPKQRSQVWYFRHDFKLLYSGCGRQGMISVFDSCNFLTQPFLKIMAHVSMFTAVQKKVDNFSSCLPRDESRSTIDVGSSTNWLEKDHSICHFLEEAQGRFILVTGWLGNVTKSTAYQNIHPLKDLTFSGLFLLLSYIWDVFYCVFTSFCWCAWVFSPTYYIRIG